MCLFLHETANVADMRRFLTGDVSAVTAAVQAVKENPPCDVCFAAVISNPSEETVRLAEEDAQKHGFMKKTNTKK